MGYQTPAEAETAYYDRKRVARLIVHENGSIPIERIARREPAAPGPGPQVHGITLLQFTREVEAAQCAALDATIEIVVGHRQDTADIAGRCAYAAEAVGALGS